MSVIWLEPEAIETWEKAEKNIDAELTGVRRDLFREVYKEFKKLGRLIPKHWEDEYGE